MRDFELPRLLESESGFMEDGKRIMDILFASIIQELKGEELDTSWQTKAMRGLLGPTRKLLLARYRKAEDKLEFFRGFMNGFLLNPNLYASPPAIDKEVKEDMDACGAFDPYADEFRNKIKPKLEEEKQQITTFTQPPDLPAARISFNQGYEVGVQVFDSDGYIGRQTSRTMVYLFLLVFEKQISECATVEDMFDVLAPFLQNLDLDTFRKTCSDIGLRGIKYERYKD